VSGDDPLLCGESADLIRQACRDAGSEERLVFHIDRSFDWGQVREAGNSLSLFAQQRLIELRIPGGKPGDEGIRVLLDWLEAPAPDTSLLISPARLDSSDQRTKWAQTLMDNGNSRFVQVWPVDGHQLPNWMRHRLAAAGLPATPGALDVLRVRVEGNLL